MFRFNVEGNGWKIQTSKVGLGSKKSGMEMEGGGGGRGVENCFGPPYPIIS